jgi:hypothetical protein
MIGPLRRSLGERFLTSTSTVCTGCRRHIHTHNTLHGAAAAQLQPTGQGSVLKILQATPRRPDKLSPLKQKQAKMSKGSAQQVKRPARVKELAISESAKSTKSNKSRSTNSVEAEQQTLQTTDNPLDTANDMTSPHTWFKADILNLYTPPTEEQIPSSLKVRHSLSGKKRGATPIQLAKTYKWRDQPLLFVEEALGLAPKISTIEFKAHSRVRYRVMFVVRWGDITHAVIGDGADKVQLPFITVY